jgi:DNA-binding SARP family transcriptional activator/tetratricopeptide (TPR) repeat protein
MARLTVSLLGSLDIKLDNQPVTRLAKGKARALLAYLAVEADRYPGGHLGRPHQRETLAGLLWPDWPERSARNNLRNILSNLRTAIGDRDAAPPHLLITRETIQFNRASDCWVDVWAFSEWAREQAPTVHHLEKAVALYRGPFLEGFSGSDSPVFDDWTRRVREQLAQQSSIALQALARQYEQRGELVRACEVARRRVAQAPWEEQAHCDLMRLLALNGQRGSALAQYEACCRALREELDVEPGEETRRLYASIQSGKLVRSRQEPKAQPTVPLPAFLSPSTGQEQLPERPIFVARERELAQLDRFLDLALAGQGRIVFVTGEAGSGKTSLLQELTHRAQDAHADPLTGSPQPRSSETEQALIAAGGNCNAYTGIGDPYLPFREILELLTGDIQANWAAGALSAEHAHRLWQFLPLAAQALVEAGPNLIDTFIPGTALLERARAYAQRSGTADWLDRLDALVAKSASRPAPPGVQQGDLFEQYTRLLQVLSQRQPLLLMLDDLQWADLGSISLLFHLGRRLAGSRILIVGAYRPEEIAIGRESLSATNRSLHSGQRERHPLEPVVHELQRLSGQIIVDLGQVEGRDFVEALLDSEPNRLGEVFREMLYRQTGGHPLFTIELLRGLQERGDVTRDAEGRWVAGPALDWEALPARVEAVIAERIGRLDKQLQAALRVASVEGEVFTAELVARVRKTGERELLERLSDELDRRHRLVRAQSVVQAGGRLLSRYQFRHILFQDYLYGSLDEVERAHLHGQVGEALEELYGTQEETVQLALHFEEARNTEKAIHYLHQAGERALQLSAYPEGRAHLTRALALLEALPDAVAPEQRLPRAEQELALQLSLGIACHATYDTYPEAAKAYNRARELSQQMGKTSQLCTSLGALATLRYVGAEYQNAHALGQEALNVAQQIGDPVLLTASHWRLGFISFALGEYGAAHAHLEQTIAFYEPHHHQALVSLCVANPGPSAVAYDACCLWCLGYPDQALRRSEEALTLARELDHPFTLGDVLSFAGCKLHVMRRDAQALKESAEELLRFPGGMDLIWWIQGTLHRGEAVAMLGQIQEGMAQMREGIAAFHAISARTLLPGTLGSLAVAQAKAGQPEEGLATLDEALATVEETGERHWEAELYRLRAELLLMQGDETGAEASLQVAIEVSRRQRAKSWELRATTSLARLWREQGRVDEARQMLVAIYDWFSEGFDSADLVEARTLLEELSS